MEKKEEDPGGSGELVVNESWALKIFNVLRFPIFRVRNERVRSDRVRNDRLPEKIQLIKRIKLNN